MPDLTLQEQDIEMKERFSKMYKELVANEDKITNEMISLQGKPADPGGYYLPDDKKANEVMRPSSIVNMIVDEIYVLIHKVPFFMYLSL